MGDFIGNSPFLLSSQSSIALTFRVFVKSAIGGLKGTN